MHGFAKTSFNKFNNITVKSITAANPKVIRSVGDSNSFVD